MNTEKPHIADSGQQMPAASAAAPHGYAGFWKRVAALLVDSVILKLMTCGTVFALDFIYATFYQPAKGVAFTMLAVDTTICWLYFTLFESSPVQTTPGKMAVGIRVTDMDGNRASFARASARYFGKFLSFLPFLAGLIMVDFTRKKQGLHDIMAGCLVVNKSAPTRLQSNVIILVAIAAIIVSNFVPDTLLFPSISNAGMYANMNAMITRAQDIRTAIETANAARAPLGLGSVWPKTGPQTGTSGDIGDMRFENSSDYFTALFDGMRFGAPDWTPYASGCDYIKCAGGGVPAKMEAGRLTAQNNAWIVAANVTDDMPDSIPVIVSRNVDPASLIPRDGDLRKQYVRWSDGFRVPFADKGLIIVCKRGTISYGQYCELSGLYGTNTQELQRVRAAFEKVKYLTP